MPHSPLGLAAHRLAGQDGAHGLCGRHGGAHRGRASGLVAAKIIGPRGLWHRAHGAAQPADHGDRCGPAVGRLVRFQRRLGI